LNTALSSVNLKSNINRTTATLIILILSVGGILFVFLTMAGFRKWSPTPLYVNIRENPVYVRSGFNAVDVVRPDFTDETWKLIDPAENQNSVIKMKNTGLKEIPRRAYLSPFKKKDQEFTVGIPFTLGEEQFSLFAGDLPGEAPLIPGIFFASIGENWEIFLNGTPVRTELYLDDEGQITSRRAWRRVHFPVARTLFKQGENLLALRIVGDPTNETTGFFYSSPYYIDDYNRILKQTNENLSLAFCAVYLFVGFYHLLLFLVLPQERDKLMLGLFSIFMGIYNLSRTVAVYDFIPDTNILRRIEFGVIFLLPPAMAAFFEYLHYKKLKLPTIIYGSFCIFAAVTQGIFSLQYGENMLTIWNISVLIFLPVAFIHDILWPIISTCRLRSVGFAILETPIGNMLIIMGIIIFSTVHDVIQLLVVRQGQFLMPYSFFIFTLGAAFLLARKFGDLYNQVNRANRNLETTVYERTKELEIQTDRAESASRAKSEFLAHMSHEIRTPLNAIIGFAEVELNKRPQGEPGENLERISESGSILLGIINDILDISKIESGHFELTPIGYSPLSLLNDVLNLNNVRIGIKPVSLETEIDESIPSLFLGDELRVKQILNNLLSNAVKYTDLGTVTFTVRWERQGEDAKVHFTIRDTGKGIKQEDLATIFSEYTRMDQRSNRHIEGTGLGLAITKKLVEMMGGNIAVESEYGKGSVFSAWIIQKLVDDKPVGKSAVENLKEFSFRPERRELTKNLDRLQMPNAYVMVVDDVVSNLMVAKGLLEPYGLNVYLVKSGQQAIDLINKGKIRFDLIFMDQMMPEMDGLETVKIIRNEITYDYAKTVPIIALTANALKGNDVMFREHGFQDFLSKPIDSLKLDEMLRKWVR
jgi:signal transduction histidine kinase